MLPAGPDVRAVYLGEGGVLARVRKGALLIDCSTIDVDTARAVAAAAAAAGFAMRDGAYHRPCRAGRQRPGGEDLQQHDARRLDDRGVRGFLTCRAARARGADI